MLCKTPPTIYETSFRYTSGAKLYVPFPSLDLYKTTEIWNSFTDVEPFYTDYVATFIIDDTILEKLTITEGDTIIPPHAPEKEGHTFNGWKTIPKLMPSENITIYGGYSVNNYKIIYIVDSEVYYTDDISYGAKIETIAEPEKEGYQFSGWKNVPDTMPAKDIVILGSFVEATSIEVPKHKEISSIKNSYDLNGKRISHTELKNNQIYILGGKKILRRK
jgi:hypothetical protein